mgnify:CR=1 FL=1
MIRNQIVPTKIHQVVDPTLHYKERIGQDGLKMSYKAAEGEAFYRYTLENHPVHESMDALYDEVDTSIKNTEMKIIRLNRC